MQEFPKKLCYKKKVKKIHLKQKKIKKQVYNKKNKNQLVFIFFAHSFFLSHIFFCF